MDRMKREKSDLVFELRRRLRTHNELLTMKSELARVQVPITTLLNDLGRYTSIPRMAREVIFRETFDQLRVEQQITSRSGKEPVVA